MYIFLNKNPVQKNTDDCVIRAISKALDKEWEDVYIDLCVQGLKYYDMPSANYVWGSYLKSNGFVRKIIPDTCPDCYKVREFAEDNPEGTFILALHGHVVAVIDGCYYDTFDSGDRVPIFYWQKGE